MAPRRLFIWSTLKKMKTPTTGRREGGLCTALMSYVTPACGPGWDLLSYTLYILHISDLSIKLFRWQKMPLVDEHNPPLINNQLRRAPLLCLRYFSTYCHLLFARHSPPHPSRLHLRLRGL